MSVLTGQTVAVGASGTGCTSGIAQTTSGGSGVVEIAGLTGITFAFKSSGTLGTEWMTFLTKTSSIGLGFIWLLFVLAGATFLHTLRITS